MPTFRRAARLLLLAGVSALAAGACDAAAEPASLLTTTTTTTTTTTVPVTAPGAVRTATGAGGAPRDDRIGPPGDSRPADGTLFEGACFNDILVEEDGAPLRHVTPPVSCSGPHDGEVFAVVVLEEPAGAPFPGDALLGRRARQLCLDRFEDFTGRDYATSVLRLAVLRPTETTWAAGDRSVVCSVYHQDLIPLVGSMAARGL